MTRAAALALCGLLAGCEGGETGGPAASGVAPHGNERFTWLVGALGDWRHQSNASGEYRVPEIVCGGVVLLDHDGDGDLDVFLVQAGTWEDLQPGVAYPGHALLRNDGDLNFTDVTEAAGLTGTGGSYCMGAAAADCDNDGDQDLYVTAVEDNFLYRNEGDGTFTDVTEAAGVGGGPAWSSSACFFDADGDGLLDLYVVNYIAYSHARNRRKDCGVALTGYRDYCPPNEFAGVQDFLFHNQGDGTFREMAAEVGLKAPADLKNHAKGLGVVATDVDDDGDVDLYVTNDSTANFLYLNDGRGHFQEDAWLRGAALSDEGQAQAGMGVDAGDIDRDGDLDLWVVHIDKETNALYVNDGRGFFLDKNSDHGLSGPAAGQVGFGTDLLDVDNDGDLDLLITNGHVQVNIEQAKQTLRYRQPDQLLENDGTGTFRLLPPEEAGRYFGEHNVGRGLATGDLDGDGDLDAVIVARDDPAVLLRNNHDRPRDSLLLRLQGTGGSNRDAIGARVEVVAAGVRQVEEVRAGSSYCSRNDLRLHFGLGADGRCESLRIRWPDGTVEEHPGLDGGFEYLVVQGAAPEAARELR